MPEDMETMASRHSGAARLHRGVEYLPARLNEDSPAEDVIMLGRIPLGKQRAEGQVAS